MKAYEPNRRYLNKILLPGTHEYEACRQNNPRGDTQDEFPQEIHVVSHVDDVVAAVKRASELGTSIGVRSGGHNLSNPALHSGVMLDVSHLNRHVEYDAATQEIAFGPAVSAKELAEKLANVDRFYPHGHCPSVAAAGFHLGSGQGVCTRGWGPTYRKWLVRLEIVVPGGHIVMASRTENQDLFWAARGSGTAFFGVVTKFWGRTIRRSKWWGQLVVFDLGDDYRALMKWFIEQSKTTPKDATELNAIIQYPDKARARDLPDKPLPGAKLQFIVSNLVLADTEAEAKAILGAYELIPADLRRSLVSMQSVVPHGIQAMWTEQDILWHPDDSALWRGGSLAIGPDVDLDKFLEAAEPRLTDMPTLRSVSWVIITDWEPDEQECAFSVPMRLCLGAFAGWRDPALTPVLDGHWRKRFRELLPFSSGTIAAEYDVGHEDMNSIPLSATALATLLKIRGKWDPEDLFPTYNKYIATSKKMAKIWEQAEAAE